MKHRILLLAGVAATIVYVGAVVLGGILQPAYSHLSQAISELIEVGAPNNAILNPLFLLYNFLTALFALGLLLFGISQNERRSTIAAAAAVLLAEAVFGFVTVFFPQDVPGTSITPTGSMHIVLAALSSVCTMAATLLMALWFRGSRTFTRYAPYSLVTLVIVFITGGIAAATTAKGLPINGLAERITIGGYLQWMLVLGLKLSSSTSHSIAR